MLVRLRILASLALSALALLSAAPALAAGGTSTSAGDQQYVDPLASANTTTPKASSGASSSTNPTASATSGSASAASSNASTTTPSATTIGSSPSSGARSSTDPLPYTGLNVGILVAAGVALLGGGLLLRRATRHA